MGLRIDVRIDTQTDRRPFSDPTRDFVQSKHLVVRLNIEHQYAGMKRIFDFLFLLAYPGEYDLFRVGPRFERAKQLTAGNDVEPAPPFGESPQERDVGVCLYGETDDVRNLCEGLIKNADRKSTGLNSGQLGRSD